MKKQSKSNWGVMRIRTAIKTRIEIYLKTDEAKKLGYTNTSQFAELVLREKLEKLEVSKK